MNPATSAIRLKNERAILDYVIINKETSRADLAQVLGVSTPTVTNIVSDLIEKNFLLEGRRRKSAAGRRTTMLQFNEDLHYVLTVEISSLLTVNICNLGGKRLATENIACELEITNDRSATQVMKNIAHALMGFLQRQPEETRNRVRMIGLCPRGMVNNKNTLDVVTLNWKDFSLPKALEAEMRLPTYAEGITRTLAYYEMRFIDPSEKNVLYLNISPGIGMVQFFDQKMIRGRTGIAGEVGHMTLDIQGPRCYCGNRGCFEYYCGIQSIIERAKALLTEENASDPFYDLAVRQHKPVTLGLLFEAQRSGSLLIHDLLKKVSEYLGAALSNLYNIYDPDRIIVAFDSDFKSNFLLENAKAEARSRIVNQFARELIISNAHLEGSQLHQAITAYALTKYLDTLY